MALMRVGIGSNINRIQNVTRALTAMEAAYAALRCSPVYEAEAMGFSGDPFLNLVAEFETQESLPRVQRFLKQLEADSGRTGNETKWSGRTLDIDILTRDQLVGVYEGVELPRGEILEMAYVLKPLADLAPSDRHPLSGKSYAEHWAGFTGRVGLDLYSGPEFNRWIP